MKEQIIETALGQYGIAEIVGKLDNPQVLKYFNKTGFKDLNLKDETSWCSAFAIWVARNSCAESSSELNARSWLKVGKKVTQPEKGDIVVFWRGKHKNEFITGSTKKKGHVGYFIRSTSRYVYVLGGNQRNRVQISAYLKSRVLGYRDIT